MLVHLRGTLALSQLALDEGAWHQHQRSERRSLASRGEACFWRVALIIIRSIDDTVRMRAIALWPGEALGTGFWLRGISLCVRAAIQSTPGTCAPGTRLSWLCAPNILFIVVGEEIIFPWNTRPMRVCIMQLA